MPEFREMTLEGVTKHYGTIVDHIAVDRLDVTVRAGDMIGVVGESGSGKSTLARMMVGLTSPSEGRISFNGADLVDVMARRRSLLEFRRNVQYIQQNTHSFNPRRSLRRSLRVPPMKLLGISTREADARIDEVLTMVGIDPAMADRGPTAVSGGQRQRFAIARALLVRPRLLICDEVVSALDVSVQGGVLNRIKEYCEGSGAALVFVSHGVPATCFIADRLMVMQNGVVVESGATEEVIRNPEADYTRRLLRAYRATESVESAA